MTATKLIEQLITDLDTGRATGRIYTYGQVQERLRAVLDAPSEAVSLNELVSAIWGVSTQDFGGYSTRDAQAVAHVLEERFTITKGADRG